ncbi:MAG TPA: serine/threonine-protein kinase [Gemmatimonadales bacterium]|nr:serine/threonine-protein kinase [Gemmatimonadales bacterium]
MALNPDDLIGQSVGPFRLERLLGQGGFAWVFAARRTDDDTPAAVKVLKPRYARDRQIETRFRHESEVAARLIHPHIVRVTAVGSEGGFTYFGMDLYEDTLGSLLEREGPLPEAKLLAIASDVTRALAFAHAQNVVHRDLKVDNVLLRPDGSAVLADFGIAGAVNHKSTVAGLNMTIGTPHYVSPEQAQGRPMDGRSDIYALGVTMYRAVTGDLPFRSADWFELARMHVEDAPTPPSQRRPGITRRLERMILRCLAKHPDDRYPSAEALLDDLKRIAKGTLRTQDIPTARPRPGSETISGAESRAGLPTWVWVLLSVVVVAAVAAAVVLVAGR